MALRGTRLENNVVPRNPGEYSYHSYSIWEEKPWWLVSEGEWHVVVPTGGICAIGRDTTMKKANHTVVEHEDGTITVSPSIVVEGSRPWHGFLQHGVFS